jgi:hypothetical protein
VTRWLSLEEAAATAHIPVADIKGAIAASELRAALVDGRLLINEAWLHAWLPINLRLHDYRMAAAHDDCGDAA